MQILRYRDLVENPSASIIICLLYALDIYNDAADMALNQFKTKFLYDEIEAEVNLVFDQVGNIQLRDSMQA